MHLRTTYLIRCVSQPLGTIVKGLALGNEGVEHLVWETNFISWRKKISFWAGNVEIRPNPSYYESQILSLIINTDKNVTETFQLTELPTWL